MRRFAQKILLFVAIYLPLEDFLLKWIPVSNTIYALLRQGSDALVLTAAVLAIGARVLQTGRIRKFGHGIDIFLICFVLSAILSTLLQQSSLLDLVLGLKALLRYVLAAYALLNVDIDEDGARRFLYMIGWGVVIQMGIGIIQFIGGPEVASFFAPRAQEEAVAGRTVSFTSTWEAESGWIFGTIGQTIGYGGFLIVGLALWITRYADRSLWYWLGSAVFILFLYNTGSRAATLAGLLVVGFHQFLIGQLSKKIIGGILAAPLLILVVPLLDSGSNYVTRAFSQDYVQEAMNQRLGIVLLVVPHFLSNLSLTDIMFGLSLDQRVLATMIADMFQVPLALLSQIGMIEDVYWAAILVYFGVVGMGFLLGMVLSVFGRLWTLLKWARTDLQQRLAHLALLVLGISFPLNLLGQYYEIRQFSFYLWVLIGLAVSVVERKKRQS